MPHDKRFDPCPCCGCADIRSDSHYGGQGRTVYSMCCYGCGLHVANRYNIEIMIEIWNRRAGSPVSERGAPCPIFPACHDQGCESSPVDCLCVKERDTAFRDLDDIGRHRKIAFHLSRHTGAPLPAEWVAWLMTRVTAPPNEGIYVHVGNPPGESGWVRMDYKQVRP